jgi:hypothetical protein
MCDHNTNHKQTSNEKGIAANKEFFKRKGVEINDNKQ